MILRGVWRLPFSYRWFVMGRFERLHFLIALFLLWQRSSFFENHPIPLFLIKRAALGNLKASFHCTHLHRFFPLKKEFFLPLRLSCKESSTFSPSPSSSGSGDVTALRCSEPLRSKVGGQSKVFARLCGMGPPGDSLLKVGKVGKGRVYS